MADDQGSTNIRDPQALLVRGFGVLHDECERAALLLEDVRYDRLQDDFIACADRREIGEGLFAMEPLRHVDAQFLRAGERPLGLKHPYRAKTSRDRKEQDRE